VVSTISTTDFVQLALTVEFDEKGISPGAAAMTLV